MKNSVNVFAYTHTHWDREWYQPFEEYRLRLIEVVDKVIDDLEQGFLNHFYFDGQTIALEDYLEIFPEKKEKITSFIKQGKISIGPWYVLADEFLVSGESLIRNLLLGIKQAKAYGCKAFIGYLPDAFGHIDDMPRILNSFGIKNSVIWRGAGEQKSLFKWYSKDGSFVYANHLAEGYFQDIIHQSCASNKKTEQLETLLDKIHNYTNTGCILLPVGADHLATCINPNKQIKKIDSEKYNIKLSSIEEYLKNTDFKDADLPAQKGELRDNSRNFILPGCFSARLYLKQENARTSWLLTKIAEPLQAIFEFSNLSKSRKNQLDYAWKLLLQNHPHDSICGCSVDSVHREMMTRFEKANQVINGVISRCLRDISYKISENEFALLNLSNYDYDGVIKIKTAQKLVESDFLQQIGTIKEFPQEILYNIQKIPVQEDYAAQYEYLVYTGILKPLSVGITDVKKGLKPINPVKVSSNSISNSLVEVKINKDGTVNVKNVKDDYEYNNLHVFDNRADVGDTYNFVPLKDDNGVKANFIKAVQVENGSLRGIIRLFYEMDIPQKTLVNGKRSKKTLKHTIKTDIIVYANSQRVDFETNWENRSKDSILQLKFKLPAKINKTISEDNFGLIERNFDPDYSLRNSMPAEFGKELKTNTSCMQRFVWAQGFGLITEGLCEYGIDGNELYLTLLRSVGVLSKAKIGTRGQAAGPPLPTPEAQCLGAQKARYSICLSKTSAVLFKEADFFYGNILSQQGFLPKTSVENTEFLNIDNKNFYLYSVKTPENKDGLILKIMNISTEKQFFKINSTLDFETVSEINSLEEPISGDDFKNKKIIFEPNELKNLWLKSSF